MAGKIIVTLAVAALVFYVRATTARSRALRAEGHGSKVYGEATGLAVWAALAALAVLGVISG